MKPISIPNNDSPSRDLRYQLCHLMTIRTNPKILHNLNSTSSLGTNKPKRDSKFLTMNLQRSRSFLFPQIMQRDIRLWTVSMILKPSVHLIQHHINLFVTRVVHVPRNKLVHLVMHFNRAAPGFFMHPVVLHQGPHSGHPGPV
ncbi:hypothetical protein HanRHA438_Chr12g0542161 [Helianthus annuus]|nr:hypothetical protein HanRHA438_Chr12g0542161 [Helianthus annuus]